MAASSLAKLLVCFSVASIISAQFEIEDLEAAPYEVIRTEEKYEVRTYPSMKWACHKEERKRYSRRFQVTGFFNLFKYITGKNEEEKYIAMTTPVTMRTRNMDGMTESQMCFFIPQEHQANVPEPSSKKVYIEERPDMTVFAKTFDGYVTSRRGWEYQANILAEDLESAGEDADLSYYYSVGYDAPSKLVNRTNEVWFTMKSDGDASPLKEVLSFLDI